MKNIVVFTGAGISAESGIQTFRDSNGLWENHDVHAVASPEGWAKDPELVLRFYNERRRNVRDVHPNEGHKALVRLEEKFDTWIVTQNIDDLHERAGSKNILHLHGEILKARSVGDPKTIYNLGITDINLGDLGNDGTQLRPHIVWFGEDVPMLEYGMALAVLADIFIIVGTSMVVYPANTLVHYIPKHCKVYVIDPNLPMMDGVKGYEFIREAATTGLPKLVERLLAEEA